MTGRDGAERLIVALDVFDREKALSLVTSLSGRVGYFKVGLQLFSACGPSIVHSIKEMGGRVFLDLKLHDIPNTVGLAVTEAVRMGVDLITLHTLGGANMMRQARQVLDQIAGTTSTPTRLLGVTVLTSMDDVQAKAVGLRGNVEQQVLRLARLAHSCGIHGIVCSPLELMRLTKEELGDTFFVTPGIRPSGTSTDDQSRVTTPAEAIALGARYVVVGRPITKANDPADAASLVASEISSAL
jgi:orotidine-5'-phosphate decarboxylase